MAPQPPLLGVTMGDPAGISSELLVKSHPRLSDEANLVVLGDLGVMEAAIADGNSELALNPIQSVEEGAFADGVMDVLDFNNVADLQRGETRADYGRAALDYIETGTDLAVDGRIDALVTAPVCGESLAQAGAASTDQMDLLADRTNTGSYTMMLLQGELVVSHVTVHEPLKTAVDRVTTESVLETIRLTEDGLRTLGTEEPLIAVAGLNPHAGADGLGDEETEEIGPAIEAAQEAGIDAMGPYAPDELFNRGTYGAYDGLVAMYHDQGHIPIYLNGMIENPGAVSGVNMTIGLPIIRTGTIQGACFEIAGRAIARPDSLIEAVRTAADCVDASR